MTNDSTKAVQQYAEAYDAHYVLKDLRKALDLYKCIIAESPNAKESDYSRSQIGNIANAVVPRDVYLDAVIEVTHAHLKNSSAD